MTVELVRTTTADGLRLDGVLQQDAPQPAPASKPLDAVVCLHGVGSNFYGSTLFERLAGHLLPLGIAVLRVNTRGHDGIYKTMTNLGSRYQGAAFEVVDECRLDIAAWIRFLQQRDYRRIGLLGHSLGAIKAVYAEAHEPHPATALVIAISPPRLSCSCFQNSPDSSRFFQALTDAKHHVQTGQPDALIRVQFPVPLFITAGGYLDKYGGERYNILNFAGRLTCPALFIYGQLEVEGDDVAFAGMPQALAALPQQRPGRDVLTIPRADHLYSGVHDVLAGEILNWLRAEGFSC